MTIEDRALVDNREAIARIIYTKAMLTAAQQCPPNRKSVAWQDGGNSHMQEVARYAADDILKLPALTPSNELVERVSEEITQVDRDAAAAWAKSNSRHAQAANMRRGSCDTAPLVQAFARHRRAAIAAMPATAETGEV